MARIRLPLKLTDRGSDSVAAARDAAERGGGRSATALILAAILLPGLLFGAFAWWSWERVQTEATATITRTTDLLAEQSLRLLRIEELLLTEADSRLAGLSWPDIIAHEADIDGYLRNAAFGVPEIDGLYVTDADGNVRLGTFPSRTGETAGTRVPLGINLSNRPYFEAVKTGAPFDIEGPVTSLVSGAQIVTIARRLTSPDGSFRGAAVVAVPIERIEQTWKDVTSPDDGVALVRDDGKFLARYPSLPLAPPGRVPVITRFKTADSGVFDVASASYDGIPRRVGFRKLAPFPIYLAYAVSEQNIAAQWYPVAVAFGVLAAAASLGLIFASSAVIRRARSEAFAHAEAEAIARALGKSEEQQRMLFRKAPAAMHSLNSERRIIDVNDRWLDLFGYDREEVVGRMIREFYVAADASERDARWREIFFRGTVQDEERQCIAKGGAIFDALISVAVERDEGGGLARVITTVTDISTRKRAEAAARGAENFAQLLIENSIDGIIVKDRALRYTVFNPAMESICGISRSEVLGRTNEEVFPRLDHSRRDRAWLDALDGRSTFLQDQPFTFPEPGRSGYCDQTVSPLRDSDGAIIGALSIVRETTERRRMEEVLRQAQKMEAVGQLTGGIAHDFNNLLTVIIGNLEQLQRHASPGSDLMRYVETAARGADRAAVLTQRLLAFSRRQPLEPRPLDLNRLVGGVSEMLRRVLGETITLETVLAGGLWRVFADANQIESALLNLAVNARDAMPEGGRLTIETANARVESPDAEVEEVVPGQYAMIVVSDTGTGMTPEVQARAFEPFYTTKETGRGSGLGLSQVYGFVRQSGGYAKIESAPGRGTSVRLYLPRLEGEVAVDSMTVPQRVAPLRATLGRTVLVVEDDIDVRAHSARLLRELGYRVLEARDGIEALAMIEEEDHLHLLFTDVGLPGGIDGRALAAEALERRPDLRVLFTTGYAAAAAAHPERFGAFPHLIAKPFTFSALAAKVHEVLAGVSQRR